jgi:hypothetical protein
MGHGVPRSELYGYLMYAEGRGIGKSEQRSRELFHEIGHVRA